MTRVSVIIPVYNAAARIGRTLDSVFAQHFTDFEIIAVNDGSTDNSERVLADYADRLKIITQKNRGPSAACNAGARAACGDYLAFLDDDDIWMPEMLSRCVEVLDHEPQCALTYTNAHLTHDDGKMIVAPAVDAEHAHAPSMDDLLTQWWPIIPSAALIRRQVFDACEGFHEELRANEDVYFWLLAREQGHFRYIPDCLVHKADTPHHKILSRTPYIPVFIEMVRARYGQRAEPLIARYMEWGRGQFSDAGLMALSEGRMKDARRCFIEALKDRPPGVRYYLRLARTFLPPKLARALSGRRGNGRSQFA
jgi:glycosyltransferase involved in cell wall biosynthesis